MRRFLFLTIACASLMLTSCTKEEIPQLSLDQKLNQKMSEMSEVAELGSVEYTINKIIKASDDATWYKVGDRKILFNCTAYMKAGIDMREFDASKVQVNEADKSVVMVLPHAKMLSFNMPPEKSTLVYEDISTFRSHFSAVDRNHLLQLGEKDILNDVPNLGILEDAEKNASSFFRSLLRQLGFEKVTIKFEN